MSKVMLLHYITILCKTTWGNSVQVPSCRTFRHSAPCLWHLQASIHGKLIFLQLQSLLRHPMIHPHDMISEHAFVMSGRERSRGTNCPSIRSQPISVTVGKLEKARGLRLMWNRVASDVGGRASCACPIQNSVTRASSHVSASGTPYSWQMKFSADLLQPKCKHGQSRANFSGVSTHYTGSCTPHRYAEHCRQASAARSSINGTGTCSSNSWQGSIS